jgi:UDP-N-acetylmuramoylalanine--D-glutamate ligase
MLIESKKIALLGLGKENLSLLRHLIKHHYQGKITICDHRRKKDLMPLIKKDSLLNKQLIKLNWQVEQSFNQDLEKFELLFRSPGWSLACPGIKKAIKAGVLVTSAMEFFLLICPSKNIIGVSGSKGKGTTASLITAILKADKKRVFLGGNIGIAPFSFFDQIKNTDWVVLELSSFQLEDLSISPTYAVLTNIFKEHLSPADPFNPNYHSSYQAYIKAKLQIASHANNKILVANDNLKKLLSNKKIKGKIIYFQAQKINSRLKGSYNQENIGAAVALSQSLKIKKDIYEKAIASFSNLEHRLELVLDKKEVKYYNNSFATTPESTILDLLSFSDPIILIAGGADKGSSFKKLANIIKARVKYLILLEGVATPRIKKELEKINFPVRKLEHVNSMAKAVSSAKKQAQPGNIVLLSTACASFGLFKNYKERGEQFKYYVKK